MRPQTGHPQRQSELLNDWIKKLQQAASEAFQRRLLVLSGSASWCREQAFRIVHSLSLSDPLWIGRPVNQDIPGLQNAEAFRLLGAETGLLVYDAHSGFDADAFGILCGTLRGGGILVLLTPPLAQWEYYPDPQHARIAVAGVAPTAVSGRFLGRLARLIQSDPWVVCLEQGAEPPDLPPPIKVEPLAVCPDPACRTPDQAAAVAAVEQVVRGHRRRPLVLISDRGRGKSSALGIAAARLVQAGRQRIRVTAPSQRATVSLFEQAARLLPGAKTGKAAIHLDSASICYAAPDQLLQQPQQADLLLVDEAAAIPTPVLEALLTAYSRIAFATTVHGYEGTGRGFALRFRKLLDQRCPQWRELRLETPIRWAPDDPLERWLFRALALNATPAPDALIGDILPAECHCEVLQRQHLAAHEQDLNDLFGLLVLAHYRTTPFDLRQLLDGPNLKVFALRARGRLVATALLATEGGFDAATAHAVWGGYRRPRGHLLAQSLAAHLGLADAARLCGGRIIRIAVHPVLQQRGLGSRLINQMLEFGQRHGFDYLGASFGATPELLRFWRKHRFQPVRMGLRRGASSGAQSVIMLHPLSKAGQQMFKLAQKRFQRQFPHLLRDPLQKLDAQLATMMLIDAPPVTDQTLDELDWLDLIGFAFAQRAYEACLSALVTLSLRALSDAWLEPQQARLLVMRVIQQRDWATCAQQQDLAGRSGVEDALRRLAGRLIAHYGDDATRSLALRIQAESLE